MRLYLLIFTWAFLVHGMLYTTELIKGSAEESTKKSFVVPICAHGRDDLGIFYVGASQAGAGTYALARLVPQMNTCVGITPEKVKLNTENDTVSPLHDKSIAYLAPMSGKHLAVVCKEALDKMYIVHNPLIGDWILTVPGLKDADGEPSGDVVSVIGASAETIFAAVKGHGQEIFGSGNSGIVAIKIKEHKTGDEATRTTSSTYECVQVPISEEKVRAALLNRTTPAVCIGNAAVESIDDIDLCWHPYLFRLYISYTVKAHNAPGNGARALAVAYLTDKELVISPIVPATALTKNRDSIVATCHPGASVALHSVRYMRTTADLDYLILLTDRDGCRNALYALPVVNKRIPSGQIADEDMALQGTLANVHGEPMLDYSVPTEKQKIPLFLNRRFAQPAQQPDDLYTPDHDEAKIGGGPIPMGTIRDVVVISDTVFAAAHNTKDEPAGIFYSQALLNRDGVIIGWTKWQRACGIVNNCMGMAYDPMFGSFLMMTGDADAHNLLRTQWGVGNDHSLGALTSLVAQYMPQDKGGVQTMRSYAPGYPGVGDTSLVVMGGLNTLIVAQTGMMQHGCIQPLHDYRVTYHARGGTITNEVPIGTQTMIFTDGALMQVGPLQATEIATMNQQGMLFVGGVKGLAVLTDEKGWPALHGIADGFSALRPGTGFRKIGNFKFIRKLIADNGFLYVLTDTSLERIPLTQDMLHGNISSTVLATGRDLGDKAMTLLDVVVSERCAILATSRGLVRVGNGCDVRTASSSQAMQWTRVDLPSPLIPCQLYEISTTGRPQDVSRFCGGQIYVLTGSYSTDRAQLCRLYVAPTDKTPVNDQTVHLIHDVEAIGQLRAYGNYGSMRSLMATDGTLFLSARNKVPGHIPGVLTRFIGSTNRIPLSLESAQQINAFARDYGSGSWLIAGDFGLRVNE